MQLMPVCFVAHFALLLPIASAHGAPHAPITLSDDGGWCWFQDERAIVVNGKLLSGTIANGRLDKSRKGNVELAIFDTRMRTVEHVTLHESIGADDHNVPAPEILPNGRVLAIFATHGQANAFWYRRSRPDDLLHWEPVRRFVPSEASRITYSNVFCLTEEHNRIYNFYRGYDNSFKPSYAYSDDLAETWRSGRVFIAVPTRQRHRPYVKYCSDGRSTVHMIYTEGHPRDYDKSIYHMFYRAGQLHTSSESAIGALEQGLARPEQGTKVYQGDPKHVAWTQDVHLDDQGRPVVVFSVQRDPMTLPPKHPDSGRDHRYHYARWDGRGWRQHEIAYAGTRLYPQEDDYTGLIVIDPDDVDTVYMSTNADPVTGQPLISQADNRRHYEIFEGVTRDSGETFSWTAVTKDSQLDNLRPVVPKWDKDHTALLWLRGTRRTFTDYDLEVVGLIDNQ